MGPEDRCDIPSALCSIGHRPLLTTGLLVKMLQAYFADETAIENPELRKRLWTSGPDTGIYIEDSTVWTPEKSGKRPAIVVRRNDWKPLKLTFGPSGQTAEGFSEYTKFWQGSHTLFIIAKEGAEVEILAAEVAEYLVKFAPAIQKVFYFLMCELVHMGAPGELKEATDRWAVPLTLAYGWSSTWALITGDPRLKRFQFSIDQLFPSFDNGEDDPNNC
jgi:hypothetical protein